MNNMNNMNDMIKNYSMEMSYQPTIDFNIIEKHTRNIKNKKDAELIYEYTKDPQFFGNPQKIKILKDLVDAKKDFLSKDQENVLLYRFKTVDLDHSKYFEGSIKIGNIVKISSEIISTTYSNNYPLFSVFLKDFSVFSPRRKEEIEMYYENFRVYSEYELVSDFIRKFETFLQKTNFKENLDDIIRTFNYDPNSDEDVTLYDIITRNKEYRYKEKYPRYFELFLDFFEYQKELELDKLEKMMSKTKCCVFLIYTKKGLVIKNFSAYPEQCEVLLSQGTRFKVMDIYDGKVVQSLGELKECSDILYKPIPVLCDVDCVEEVYELNKDKLLLFPIIKQNIKFIILEEQ
jgi:hypothetical protein